MFNAENLESTKEKSLAIPIDIWIYIPPSKSISTLVVIISNHNEGKQPKWPHGGIGY